MFRMLEGLVSILGNRDSSKAFQRRDDTGRAVLFLTSSTKRLSKWQLSPTPLLASGIIVASSLPVREYTAAISYDEGAALCRD